MIDLNNVGRKKEVVIEINSQRIKLALENITDPRRNISSSCQTDSRVNIEEDMIEIHNEVKLKNKQI